MKRFWNLNNEKIKVYFDSVDGQKLINIYNIVGYPFIGIIDPRTGEKLIQIQSNKFDSCSFCEKITSFLCDFETPNNEEEEVPEVLVEEEVQVVLDNPPPTKQLGVGSLQNYFNIQNHNYINIKSAKEWFTKWLREEIKWKA